MTDDNEAKAKAMVDQLEALHDSLLQAWLKATNDGDYDKAKEFNDQADRAGDQLILANEHLLDVIDSGKDVTDLLTRLTALSTYIKAQQDKVAKGTAEMGEVSGVLDTVGQAITVAQGLSGGTPAPATGV